MTLIETIEAKCAELTKLGDHERWLRNCRAPIAEIREAQAAWNALNDELCAIYFMIKKRKGF